MATAASTNANWSPTHFLAPPPNGMKAKSLATCKHEEHTALTEALDEYMHPFTLTQESALQSQRMQFKGSRVCTIGAGLRRKADEEGMKLREVTVQH